MSNKKQTESTGHHGGAREGAGRPAVGEVRRNVTLSNSDESWLRDLGGGSLSKGIALAVARLRKMISAND